MALFQKSVLNKYLNTLNDKEVEKAFALFQEKFNDPERLANISEGNEEQYQYGFLSDLFQHSLGYTLFPNTDFNLRPEVMNEGKSAKKADGVIYKDGEVIAVIELKSTKTPTMEKIKDQAFGYMHHHSKCQYVITSNFRKLRFYIGKANEFEDFELFNMGLERFKLLYLCLNFENLTKGVPNQIKEDSKLTEEDVTKKLYKDYKQFKNDLYHDISAKNPNYDKLLLFKKTQKLLDRLLFIFFAEDMGLLPPNSISKIVDQWNKLKELDEVQPLYDRIKKYFGYLNTGHKGKQYDVYAYNGGLFLEDEVLDNIVIDDELLRKHCLVMSTYDFSTEVDVNILGHIFEHSLSEIEEEEARLTGQVVEKSKTKRKKDGVFYTPKYITQYIVENTIGQLCEEKKTAIGIKEEEFEKSRKGRKKETLKKLKGQLEDYKAYLLSLKICDPACGSGAFLNQALNFLISEHNQIAEWEKLLLGSSIAFNIESSILEHNLYGVDINEEAVEIAKLSLWLRTAEPERKLTTLSNNIKCGNSLIDDSNIAGDKAFKWEEEFPEVFEK